MKSVLKLIAIGAGLISMAPSASAEECLKIARDMNGTPVVAALTPGVQMAFKKAGICAKYVELPNKRIQRDMVAGDLDGEYFRVSLYVKAMSKHVVAVPTSVKKADGIIVTLASSGFKPSGLQDVGDKKIGIVHGTKWHEIFASKIKDTSKAKNYGILAKKLKAERIDGFLIEGVSLESLVKSGVLAEADIHKSKPIIDLSAYVLLHKKNEKLVSKLDDAIKAVKKEGGFKLQ